MLYNMDFALRYWLDTVGQVALHVFDGPVPNSMEEAVTRLGITGFDSSPLMAKSKLSILGNIQNYTDKDFSRLLQDETILAPGQIGADRAYAPVKISYSETSESTGLTVENKALQEAMLHMMPFNLTVGGSIPEYPAGNMIYIYYEYDQPVALDKLYPNTSDYRCGIYIYVGLPISGLTEQTDSTLDVSAASEGDRYRIMNSLDLHASFGVIEGVEDNVVVELQSGVWTIIPDADYTYYGYCSRSSSEQSIVLANGMEGVTSKYFRFTTYPNTYKGHQIQSIKTYVSSPIDQSSFTNYDATWGILCARCHLSADMTMGELRMILVDVKGPNELGAVTLSKASDIGVLDSPSLMNLKIVSPTVEA